MKLMMERRLDMTFEIPPSPMIPLLKVTVGDVRSMCVLSQSLKSVLELAANAAMGSGASAAGASSSAFAPGSSSFQGPAAGAQQQQQQQQAAPQAQAAPQQQ